MSSEAKTFSPREIVSELDRFIVGQAAAKRAVAVALRNRWRRLRVPEPLGDEIAPKNIIMIGPAGSRGAGWTSTSTLCRKRSGSIEGAVHPLG